MADLGMITPEERDEAIATEIKVTGNRTPNGCVATLVDHWGFFCDFFARWWVEQKAFGKDIAERDNRLRSGGYRITTTMDVQLQDSAKKNVEKELKTGNRDALMVAAIEPGTGYVRALAANRIYGLDDKNNPLSSDPRKRRQGIKATYPVTTNPILTGGGDIVGYKGGSTFKIFTMVAALEKGYPLDFNIVAVSPYRSKYITSPDDIARCGNRWCPRNASPSMNGPRNMWSGFGLSVNTYFVPLIEKVGADKAIDVAKRMGIKFREANDKRFVEENPSGYGPFTIGVSSTVPLELANAYATLAAEGKYCEPMPVIEILDRNGNKIEGVADPRCEQVITPEVARAAVDAA